MKYSTFFLLFPFGPKAAADETNAAMASIVLRLCKQRTSRNFNLAWEALIKTINHNVRRHFLGVTAGWSACIADSSGTNTSSA